MKRCFLLLIDQHLLLMLLLLGLTGHTGRVSPCSTLVRDLHEAHVVAVGWPVLPSVLTLEAGKTGLFHTGLLS